MDQSDHQLNRPSSTFQTHRLRHMLFICMFIIPAVALCACTLSFDNSSNKQKSTNPAEIENVTGFKFRTEQTEYSSQANKINFTIENESSNDAIFGAAYALEMLQNGSWYTVPFKGVKGDTQPTWPAIGYMLPAQGIGSGAIDLSNHKGVLPGRYRLIKTVNLQVGSQKTFVLATQFNISETISRTASSEAIPSKTSAAIPSVSNSTTTETSIIKYTAQTTPDTIRTIQSLIDRSDDVIIGTVATALPTVRIDLVALGYVNGKSALFQNVSSYVFRVDQVIMGKMTPGEQIKMDMHGGIADGVSEDYGIPYPKTGGTYLLFITRRVENQSKTYFKYLFVGTFEGYSEIRDGKIIPREKAQLFKLGTPIEQVLDTIRQAVRIKEKLS